MSNNEPDYNNLAFEPEMTWEKLVEKAKELGGIIGKNTGDIYFSNLVFEEDGGIYLDDRLLDDDCNVIPCISSNRTPAQMYQIIKALED